MKNHYEIKGYYFPEGEEKKVLSDTHFHYAGSDSMIDHQKMWYDESLKLGHESGEIDEAEIIKANYDKPLTEEQLMAIVNNGELMDTPFSELFPTKITENLTSELQKEYDDLEQYVNENESKTNCESELERMKEIINEIARLSPRVNTS